MTTALAKGGNTVLSAAVCRVTLSSPTTGIDVSSVLLGQDGKVRSDDDLVFYNHASQDGIKLNGQTIVADLAAVPATVDRIAVVASIDPELRATHFEASNTPMRSSSAEMSGSPLRRHRSRIGRQWPSSSSSTDAQAVGRQGQ
ncbi:TerD family protein [Streptomyces sp. NPDC056653]|uniref:TerD family protein n=1 Tax=Streptomyces sp. NPDC056653 TaxID=3345894 RepID=UPI003681247B